MLYKLENQLSLKKNRIDFPKLLFQLGIICFILLLPIWMVHGQEEQSNEWTAPVQLSDQNGASAWFPDISIDSIGMIHVVWSSPIYTQYSDDDTSTYDGYDAVIYTQSENGIEWREPMDIVALEQLGGSEATRPALFYSESDVLHLTFRDMNVFYSQSSPENAGDPQGWKSKYQLNSEPIGYFSRIAEDQDGNLHAIYTQNIPNDNCQICYHVLYRKSLDGGASWSGVTDISLLPTGAAKPQIMVDQKNYIHVVWEEGRGGSYGNVQDPSSIKYSVSYDGGNSWIIPYEFNGPSGRARNPGIGIDGDGRVLVTWLGLPEDEIYFQTSENYGRSWSSPSTIPNVFGGWSVYQSRHDAQTMTTDSDGNIHLVFVGKTDELPNSLDLVHIAWNHAGEYWHDPEVVYSYTGDVPEWPRVMIDPDNVLHLTWYVRDEAHVWDTDNQKYHVWYSQSDLNIPTIAVTQPSASDTPQELQTTVTRTQAPDPSATLSATRNPNLGESEVEPLGPTESQLGKLIISSLIPVVAILAIGGLAVRYFIK